MGWWKSKSEKELDAALERLGGKLSKLVKERDEALAANLGYEGQVVAYAQDLERESRINNALAEQNRDLVRQLELYKAVLAQLSIPVKLPARRLS